MNLTMSEIVIKVRIKRIIIFLMATFLQFKHMKNLILFISIVIPLVIVSCSKTNDGNNPEVPQSVISKSLNYFNGELIEEKLEEKDGVKAWEIKIQNSNGSIVKFYWSMTNESLLKMEGLVGPFDYDIQPGNDIINLSTALTIALGAVKNDSIIKWELEQEDDFIDKWIYTFEFDVAGSLVSVYIDAENGDILEID